MDIAHCGISNPERDCQRVLVKRFQLSLDVERVHLGNEPDIPILRMQSWFAFFLKNSCLHILHGLHQRHDVREQAIMAAFWRNFRESFPNHEIFQREAAGLLCLERCIPLQFHGDEGRGRRHTAHFVLSMHSPLGFGFGKQTCKKTTWTKMECNFSGHTFTNRFLLATLRKKRLFRSTQQQLGLSHG